MTKLKQQQNEAYDTESNYTTEEREQNKRRDQQDRENNKMLPRGKIKVLESSLAWLMQGVMLSV